jgi:AcrR family transcriptional regulator
MAEVMAEKGYVSTSVEDVLRRAGVSRLSFYKLFDSKLDCFMSALALSAELVLAQVAKAIEECDTDGDPLKRYERVVTAYLEAVEEQWAPARLCLVEVYAAGPDAFAHRRRFQAVMADIHAGLLGATDERGLLTCRMLAASTITLVSNAIAENDREGLRAAGPQLVEYVRSLWECGAFGEGTGPS